MATTEQIEANRSNAQQSTGPQTPGGKAAASRNARKHGLASRDVVIPEEDRKEFEDLLAALSGEHQPQSRLEECLVAQMAAAEWRLRRIVRIETGLLVDRLDDLRDDLRLKAPQPPPGQPPAEQEYHGNTRLLGRVFYRNCNGTDSIVKLLRYENSTRRAFYKALHEFRLAQSRRNAAPAAEH